MSDNAALDPGTPDNNRDRFMQTLALTTKLSGTAYRVAEVLTVMALKGSAYPSEPTLARMLGSSERQIRRAFVELEKCGAFEVYRDPGRTNLLVPGWHIVDAMQPVWDRYHAVAKRKSQKEAKPRTHPSGVEASEAIPRPHMSAPPDTSVRGTPDTSVRPPRTHMSAESVLRESVSLESEKENPAHASRGHASVFSVEGERENRNPTAEDQAWLESIELPSRHKHDDDEFDTSDFDLPPPPERDAYLAEQEREAAERRKDRYSRWLEGELARLSVTHEIAANVINVPPAAIADMVAGRVKMSGGQRKGLERFFAVRERARSGNGATKWTAEDIDASARRLGIPRHEP